MFANEFYKTNITNELLVYAIFFFADSNQPLGRWWTCRAYHNAAFGELAVDSIMEDSLANHGIAHLLADLQIRIPITSPACKSLTTNYGIVKEASEFHFSTLDHR